MEGGQPSNPRQAIQKGNYVDNQCWLNTLTDYYKDSLMNNKKKEPMSRGMILKLHKTEQEFTESGALIDDMIPVFMKYRMRVRIIDQLGKIFILIRQRCLTATSEPFLQWSKFSYLHTEKYS